MDACYLVYHSEINFLLFNFQAANQYAAHYKN